MMVYVKHNHSYSRHKRKGDKALSRKLQRVARPKLPLKWDYVKDRVSVVSGNEALAVVQSAESTK